MFYEFINENQIKEFKGDFVVIDNRIYTSPTAELIKAAGYKPLVYTEQPECNENQYLESYYFDGDEAIEVRYNVVDIPEVEIEEEPIEEEEPQEEVVEEEVPSEE